MLKTIKKILKSVRQYKKASLITPIFMIGEVIVECALPFVMSVLGDYISNLSDAKYFFEVDPSSPYHISLFALILILIGMTFASLFFGIMGGKYAAKASVGFATNLRNDLYRKIQTFSFSNIDKFSSSSLITRMTTDVNNVQMSFQMMIRIVVRAPLMMVFCTAMAFITGGQMAWIFLALIPIVVIGLFLIGKNAMKIFTRVFKRYDKLNESIEENVSGIRVVKSFVREEFEKQKFNKASDSMTGDFVHAEKIIALNNPLMNTTIHMSNILVLGIGTFIIYSNASLGSDGQPVYGKLTPYQMSSLLTYGIQILSSLMIISMVLVMLVMSLESVKRIGEVLNEKPTIVNPKKPIYEIKTGSVEFKNVNFKYKEAAEKYTLENINLKIKSGQFIGILGSTGSGKTSIINLISRLYDVSEGEVLVDNKNVKEYDLKTLRDNVAVVLQKNVLFSGTIASNLKWGNLDASEEQIWEACRIAQAEEAIRARPNLLETRVEQGGTNFSGGQKQRICIARALLKNPKILILDDSTSAVDTKTDRLIRTALKNDLPEMTKIVIAQRISSIEDADQIIIMDNGKINAIGTHEELLKNNPIYQEVYFTQTKKGGKR